LEIWRTKLPHAVRVAVAILALSGCAFAQPGTPTSSKPPTVPESGFVAPGKYINAFFGFVLPLPQNETIHPLTLPSNQTSHVLFGLQANQHGLAILTVFAKQKADLSDKAVSKEAGSRAKQITIGGRQFWVSESQKKVAGGDRNTERDYTTGMNGYLLEFSILSFDPDFTKQLQQDIESISFFDPAKAAEIAGPGATLSPVAAAMQPQISDLRQLDPGIISGDVYSNKTLGFAYQFPHGWIVADQNTQNKVIERGHQLAWGNDPEAAREHEYMERCMRPLLWVTEYPEGTHSGGANQLIAVSAMAPGCFQGFQFPTSLDDRNAIKSTSQQMLSAFATGMPALAKGNFSVSAFITQSHLILDLSGSFKISPPGSSQPLETFISVDFTELNGYLAVWMFSSGTESGLKEIKNTRIQFAPVSAR
jgi:hypothetical protein